MWGHSDLYSWPYYVVHFSYSFALLLLSIFIYNSWRLYNLDFKYIILPLYVSFSKICIKLKELRKKLIKVWNFILSISVSDPPLWGIILSRVLLHTLHVIMHELYHWPTKLHCQSQVTLILFFLVAVASGNRGGYWTLLGHTMNTAKSICEIKYCAIALTRTF